MSASMLKVLAFYLLFFAALAEAQIKLVKIAGNLDRPVDIASPVDGTARLFIVQQTGKILVYDGSRVLTTPFLNISNAITCCGEEGLLSLAFHPNYENNGFFYIYYTNTSGNLVLARYTVSSKPNVARPGSNSILLTIPHPQHSNHNGGEIAFGKDGYLYLSVGDGGGGGDQRNNAQNLGELLGKILRIDVNNGTPYSIPSNNPFRNRSGAKKEVWAYGLRNPWRISFDRLRGGLYIADVGQGDWEEVSLQPANSIGGINYGWRRMEGKHCYNPRSSCNDGTLKTPFVEYNHSEGCSVTGGYVYRGNTIPALVGTYLFADYCAGTIWGSKRSSGRWTTSRLLSSGLNISTFGEGENGELYLAHHSSSGAIYRITKN